MKRSPRRLAWLAVFVAFLGCTQVVEFDRSKIDHDGGDAGGGTGGMDAQPDSTVVVPADSAVSDTSAPPPDAGLECSEHTDCKADELCCSNKCIPTSANTGCEACNTPCSATADTCTGRSCTCGKNASCSGATPFCAAASEDAANRCLECRGDDDCSAEGARQCVGGECVQCDVADGNSGCLNPAPICDERTSACVGCDSNHPCGSGMQCVNGGCYGCDDATNAGCDPNGTTPICEPAPSAPQAGLYQCVGCTTGAQCTGNPNGSQCVAGACEACDPRAGQGNAGCGGATPICDATTSTCRACGRPGDCGGTTGSCSTSGQTAGRCVACTLHTQCSGATPFCDPTDGTCKACNAYPGGAGLDNAFCEDKNDAQPICDASGRCVPCNATGGCSGTNDQCVVNAAAPQNNICVDCVAPAVGCSAGQTCAVNAMPAMNRCVACVTDDQCPNDTTPFCVANTCVGCNTVASGANARCAARTTAGVGDICVTSGGAGVVGACRDCDPGDHDGCTAATQLCCVAGGEPSCRPRSNMECTACDTPCSGMQQCSGNMCVACTANAHCAGTPATPFCMGNECVATCPSDADCQAVSPTLPHCVSGTCRECDPATGMTCTPPAMCMAPGVCMP